LHTSNGCTYVVLNTCKSLAENFLNIGLPSSNCEDNASTMDGVLSMSPARTLLNSLMDVDELINRFEETFKLAIGIGSH